MELGILLMMVHPEVMQICEMCHGNGQYYINSPNYLDPTPDVEQCQKCNGLGHVLNNRLQ